MKKLTVFVTGHENAGGVSGWDWFFDKSEADEQFSDIQKSVKEFNEKHPTNKAIKYRGEVEVEVDSKIPIDAEVTKEEIAAQVELFLEKNEFEKAFN